MDTIKIINIFSIVTSFVWLLVFISIYKRISNRNKCLLYWIIGIIFYNVYLGLGFLIKGLVNQDHTVIGNFLLGVSYIFLVLGTEVFITIRRKKIWGLFLLGVMVLILAHRLMDVDYSIMFLVYIGSLFACIGMELLATKKPHNFIIGSFFLLWGIFNFLWQIFHRTCDFDIYLYIINRMFFGFSGAMFIISYFFKRNLDYEFDNENIKSMFQASSVGLELYNANAELIIINPICREMFEIDDHKTVIGSNLFDRFDIAKRSLEQVRKGYDVSFRVEFDCDDEKKEHLFKDDFREKKYLEVRISILGMNKLKPEGYFVQIQDISEHIFSSHQLEERLKLAVRSTNLYEYDWYLKSDEVYIDPLFAISLGYEGEYFNGKSETLNNHIKEEDIVKIEDKLEKHFRCEAEVYSCEWRIRSLSGGYKWFVGIGSVIERDEDGSPVRMVGINQCIEERKQSELKLYNSEKRYRSLFETMINGYARLEILYDNEGNIYDYRCIETNSSLEKITGLECVEGKTINDLITQEKYWIDIIDRMLKEGSENRVEQYSRKLGKILEIVMHQFGKDQFILIIRDVTNERNLENMLRQTEKLSAIGQLVGGIAHDFNNQLMAIGGAVSIIKNKCGTDMGCRKYIDYIEKCSNNSASLVNRLLTFSRESDYELLPIDLHDIINSVVEILERSIDKKIIITTSLKAENHRILGDESQIQNTLLNIGINARDAMVNGGKLVFRTYNTMECCSDDDTNLKQGPGIVIIISDTGIGMSEEVKKHMFEPFFTTKGIGKGTGMGLAMVFGIIKNHGGCISVNSVINVGTDFTIKLPLIDEKDYYPLNEQEKLVKGIEKIMIVDDEEILRELLKEMIEMLGYQVMTFGDGYQALDYYQDHQHEIHLVLLDVVMPKLSGRELLEKLYEINNDIKVGFLSGYGFEEVKNDKVIGFINKPINIEELSIKIRRMLDKETLH